MHHPQGTERMSLAEFKARGLHNEAFDRTKKKKRRWTEEDRKDNTPPPRKTKMGNRQTMVDGILFDSKWEAERYCQLKLEEKAGTITDLRLQVPYQITINGIHICQYTPDFVYIRDGKLVVEDAKGHKTRDYKLRKKLMKAVHGIDILETYQKNP